MDSEANRTATVAETITSQARLRLAAWHAYMKTKGSREPNECINYALGCKKEQQSSKYMTNRLTPSVRATVRLACEMGRRSLESFDGRDLKVQLRVVLELAERQLHRRDGVSFELYEWHFPREERWHEGSPRREDIDKVVAAAVAAAVAVKELLRGLRVEREGPGDAVPVVVVAHDELVPLAVATHAQLQPRKALQLQRRRDGAAPAPCEATIVLGGDGAGEAADAILHRE
eukprot:4117823-Pleurochrysis_carterae.AAC.3